MKLRPSYDMSKFRLGPSGILNDIMGSGPRLASPNFILGGALFSGGFILGVDLMLLIVGVVNIYSQFLNFVRKKNYIWKVACLS